MRKVLFFFLMPIALSGQIFPKEIEYAPGTGYILKSGSGGIYDHVIDAAGIDSVKCISDTLRIYAGGTQYKTQIDCSKTNEIQTLSIDSTLRTFSLSISSGNTIKFQDTKGVSSITADYPLTGGTITESGTIGVDTTGTVGVATKYDLSLVGGGMDSTYNGVRVIQRVPVAGSTNMNAATFRQWLDWWYQKNYQAPTLTFNSISPTVVEVGSSTSYTLAGSTSNPCAFTLASGTISSPSGYSFGSATSFSTSYTHLPTTAGTTTLTASQGWTMTTGSCEAGSPTTGTASASRSINNVYPVLWGMSASDWSGGGVPYSSFTLSEADNISLHKRLVVESDLTGLKMYGTNMYIYILIPKSWSVAGYEATSIIDHNNFDVTASFTAYDVTVTSTGLTNNWTQNYKMYKLNSLTTASNYAYKYNR